MLFAIAVVIFAAVALVVWAFFRPKEDVIAQRIRSASYQERAEESPLEGSVLRRVIGPLVGRAGSLVARLVPHNAVRRIDHLLVMAGQPVSLPVYLAFWAGTVLFGGLFLFEVVLSRPDLPHLQLFGISLFVLFFAGYTPYMILMSRVRRRQKSIVRALPDALDLLVTCMEAGLGMDAAFAKVTEKNSGPLAEAFALYLRQVGLGRARRDALAVIAERTGVPDLARLAAAVVQAEAMGTTMGDVMRAQAEDLRLARRDRARETAHRAPVLMTIPMILCFLPAMGVVVIVPSMLNLVHFIGGLGGG